MKWFIKVIGLLDCKIIKFYYCTCEQCISTFGSLQKLTNGYLVLHFTAALHTVSSLRFASLHSQTAMKDKLAGYLHPTAYMKKAIDRNAKQDENLSLVLKQLNKEKKMALNQLSRKQDAFKKEMIKRRDSLPQQFKVQFFQQRTVVSRDGPRSDESTQANRLLRRTLSCPVENYSTANGQLPAEATKRHSLPASPLPLDSSGKLTSRFTFKPGSEVTSPQRIESKQSEQEASTNEDDYIEALPPSKLITSHFGAKSQGFAAQNTIRRQSEISAAVNPKNSRLLQRRTTIDVLHMAPTKTCLNETLFRL